jgi:acetaldehyde dehydrogenase (acetylating)
VVSETPGVSPKTDRDLASIQQARELARRAKAAQAVVGELTQQQIDTIVDAMAAAVRPHAEALARLAVEETGYGVVADKVRKNLFATDDVHRFIRPMTTVGVVRRLEDRKVIEIAEPFGVVAAIIPSTNPTSTAIYKILIAVKARCAIVLSPHPSAMRCITRVAELMDAAARQAGAPEGIIGCLQIVTLEGTQELMKQREVAVILATGGLGLVRAAYSAGKPAYGVGPGNAPAYVESSADVPKATRDIITGKTFDNGLLCSSENSVVVDRSIAAAARAEFQRQGAYFLSDTEAAAVAALLVTPQRLPNPAVVGRPATVIAQHANVSVPPSTRVLIAELQGVGRDFPLSIEKLCPVLSWYVVSDWREACERCKQILRYGGMGHTMAIHSKNDDVILQFGLHKPAFRIVVNTPTTHGSIGLTTGLDPAMTLGCGGYGGNITSDNISPMHLLNIKRVAYEVRPAQTQASAEEPVLSASGVRTDTSVKSGSGVSTEVLRARIDAFLALRGFAGERAGSVPSGAVVSPSQQTPAPDSATAEAAGIVCEEDVRAAIRAGKRIRIGDRTIVTPAARDLAGEHGVFET